MFAYPCPSCSQRLLAPPERAGQRTICPKCLKPLTVPPATSELAPTPAIPFGPLPKSEAETPVPIRTTSPREPEPIAWESEAVELNFEIPLLSAGTIELHEQYGGAAVAVAVPPKTLTQTPAPRAPVPKPTPVKRQPAKEREGQVVLNPTGLFSVDIAAELSAAISMRMAPPPEPAADRQLILAGWLGATVLGLATWALGLLFAPAWLAYSAIVGGLMVLFGVFWRAHLAAKRGSWLGGIVSILPPICLIQLVRPAGSHGLRPLRFAVTGAVLIALFAVGPKVRAYADQKFGLRNLVGANEKESNAKYSESGKAEASNPEEFTETAVDLAGRLKSDNPELRASALNRLADLEPEAAANWAAAHLADRTDRDAAKKCLHKLGAKAETAVVGVLSGKSETAALIACEWLELHGTNASLEPLKTLAEKSPSRNLRLEVTSALDAIRTRTGK